MKRYKKWTIAGVAISIMGVIAGCGTTNNGTTPTTNVTNTVTNTTDANNTSKSIASTNTTNNVTYNSYQNDRFGFTVQYPSTWIKGQTPTDQDGLSFSTTSNSTSFDNGLSNGTPKSNVVLTAVGTVNAVYSGDTFNQMANQMKSQYIPSLKKTKGISSVTYGVVPNKWVWIEYTQNLGKNTIQVQKSYTTLKSNQTITLVYPSNESSTYMPIWSHISNSFVVGNKNG
jgi:hypothetical protein